MSSGGNATPDRFHRQHSSVRAYARRRRHLVGAGHARHDAPGALDQSAEILVLPNGSLLALIARFQLEGDGAVQKPFAIRSPDHGRTWHAPVQVTSQPIAPIQEPDLPLRGNRAGGTVYIAWDRAGSATSGTIDIAKSGNGGLCWSAPTPSPGRSTSARHRGPPATSGSASISAWRG
jgi:hypothetical protein